MHQTAKEHFEETNTFAEKSNVVSLRQPDTEVVNIHVDSDHKYCQN